MERLFILMLIVMSVGSVMSIANDSINFKKGLTQHLLRGNK